MNNASHEFLSAQCPLDMSSAPDFYKYGSDNSFGCYVTNYILALSTLIYSVYLWQGKDKHWRTFQEHTRFFVIGKNLCIGISVAFAGFVHQGVFGRAGDVHDPANSPLWLVVEGALMIAGGLTFCASHTLLVEWDNSRENHWWYLVSFVIGSFSTVGVLCKFGTNAFGIAGFFGEVVPDLWLLAHIGVLMCADRIHTCAKGIAHIHKARGKYELNTGAFWTVLSVVVILVGGLAQFGLGSTCGVPCPMDCVFPAPAFDHNAFFHVAQLVGMGLMARGMNHVCTAVEMECRSCDWLLNDSNP